MSQDVENRQQKFSIHFVLTFFYICYKFSKHIQHIQTYSVNNVSKKAFFSTITTFLVLMISNGFIWYCDRKRAMQICLISVDLVFYNTLYK